MNGQSADNNDWFESRIETCSMWKYGTGKPESKIPIMLKFRLVVSSAPHVGSISPYHHFHVSVKEPTFLEVQTQSFASEYWYSSLHSTMSRFSSRSSLAFLLALGASSSLTTAFTATMKPAFMSSSVVSRTTCLYEAATMADAGVPAHTSEPSPVAEEVDIPTNLPSDCGKDYIPLATLLAAGQLAEADQVCYVFVLCASKLALAVLTIDRLLSLLVSGSLLATP